ncbi:MAG: NAD(P)-dependent oxidoreductase [Rhodospirillales bacterium]|nr:NAD(P)-dependent oxidoreductase [Rhodospirillales bacterium]
MSLDGKIIGFIGLGLMGRPMARNLKNAGATVVICNRSRGVVDELAGEGMIPAASPAEVASKCDTVIVMTTNTETAEQVVIGEHGIVAGLRAGALIIDMGTTLAASARRMADAVKAKGGHFMDAPVSGGTPGAEAATLTIMVGGSEESFQRALPVFDVLGSRATRIGEVGTGQVAKAANQVIVGLNIGAVAEALSLAKHAGADPARVREALKGGFADSKILEVHGQRMIDGNFTPGARITTQHKDMSQALMLAAEFGLELPATALGKKLYEGLMEKGYGDLDHSALIKAIDPE